MQMYWIYNYANWQLGLMIVAGAVSYGIAGLLATRFVLGSRKGKALIENEIVSYYFGALVGFFGITLGLISVGVWQTFSDADVKSATEAAAVEALYRDVSSYPEPQRSDLQGKVKEYLRHVIEDAWPQQRSGQTPTGGTKRMTDIQTTLFPFEPQTQGQMAVHQEALKQFNRVSELRRLRVLSATAGLPPVMWWIVIIGACLAIAITWFFIVESVAIHAIFTAMLSALLGLLIFITAAMDNPYRGEFSVGPDAFQLVYERVKEGVK